MTNRAAIVYVHGLWMTGIEGGLLRRRLEETLGAPTFAFRYRSVRDDVLANSRRLAHWLSTLDAQEVHLVAHSLGGVVIQKMFESVSSTTLPPGRVVFLGSPVGGSRAAQSLAKVAIGRAMLGRTVSDALLQPVVPRWAASRDLGVIAGIRNVGLGRLVNRLEAPSDGTVYVDETLISGMKEHIVVPVTHIGLPISFSVAQLTGRFLQIGRFAAV